MQIRNVQPSDYQSIITVLDEWWGGRRMRDMLPRLFFEHFCDTSSVLEEDGRVVAFLIGFLSQNQPTEAYIHFVGVHPNRRQRGCGRLLYERFFEQARLAGRSVVRCVTSPTNTGSIAFHTRMGFQVEPGKAEREGVPYDPDHDGPGEDRVCFLRKI